MVSQGVVTPQSSGLGGGFFALVYRAKERRTYVLDAREVAPAKVELEVYASVPEKAKWGGLAVAVPGEVRGYQALHKRWGKLSWRDLFRPGIRQAQEGTTVNGYLAYVAGKMDHRFQRSPLARGLYWPAGVAPKEGDRWVNPDLARTLEALGEKGADWFYRGAMGRDIVAEIQKQGGVLTLRDLKKYQVRWRQPLSRKFRDFQVVTMPPPSSGGLVLLECLEMLSHLDLEKLGWNSSAYLHHLAEVMKMAYADRATWMADPDFHPVPTRKLLDPARLARMAGKIHPFHVQDLESYRIGLRDDHGTAHLSVVDAAGNVVVATSTVNYGYGSLVVVPGRGFVLNNQMDDFSLAPGDANLFGLVQSEKNGIQAGKRPLSSMSPTVVLKNGHPVLALGGSGGPRIISGTLQVLLNVLVFERELQEAVSAPRIHHQWKPDELRVERHLPRDLLVGLRRRGQRVVEYDRIGGKVQAIQLLPQGLKAASDPRKRGRPAGY
jgi:gamma-glutamyltranspeptidase/glutathione hydrolase